MSDWSFSDGDDINQKLAELNNWQFEQQKKLKEYQETQRKLLDSEHRKILDSLRTHNYNDRHNDRESNSPPDEEKTSEIFQFKTQPIKLKDPKRDLFHVRNPSPEREADEPPDLPMEDDCDEKRNRPRRFLRRGEGLARFGMKLDDFKAPPNIYREKKIKTYLKEKPDFNMKKFMSIKNGKTSNDKKKSAPPVKKPNKTLSLPVNIYVSDKCKAPKPEVKINTVKISSVKKTTIPKTPVKDLVLKPCEIATNWYNIMKQNEKEEVKENSVSDVIFLSEHDLEVKRDEKDLRVFEILEGKIDDSSFCSNSSFVNKLMEESITSTPTKESGRYVEGLKNSQKQHLDEQFQQNGEVEVASEVKDQNGEVIKIIEAVSTKNEKVALRIDKSPKIIKKQLEDYIKGFRKLKSDCENMNVVENEEVIEEEPKKVSDKELTLKIQRKALQDNVKHLLNWESSTRKKPKKVINKKPKIRQPKLEKPKNDKLAFDGALLKERLDELEKEIEIFRKENRNLTKLQKDLEDDRTKFEREKKEFEREKKEFEKETKEKREEFENKMAEEQKKLQRDKSVFDKYCKQMKNQPNKQEREEITNLRKQVEKLAESLSTKESRFGASQARLRNQIKGMEKENQRLKNEIEKYKKQTIKKVTFHSGKNIQTKIIHAINSELGKLKPQVIRNEPVKEKHNSLSARVDVNKPKPIRRIKSVPDFQKDSFSHVEMSKDYKEKVVSSVSTDSGVETNDSRRSNEIEVLQISSESNNDSKTSSAGNVKSSKESPCQKEANEEISRKERTEDAVYEALFSSDSYKTTNPKLLEIKNRLKKLNLQDDIAPQKNSKEFPGSTSKDLIGSGNSLEFEDDDEEEEVEEESAEEEDDEEKDEDEGEENDGDQEEYTVKGSATSPRIIENKSNGNGVRERIYEDGRKEIFYPNGNVKKISPNGKIVQITYYNGDVKEIDVKEGSEKYYYAETKTWHTAYEDGLEVLEFPNGQTERRRPDGSTEISFPNGCVRYCDPSGRDEWRFIDGTVVKTNKDGEKVLLMPNGQKEIHTKEYKRREYPDGTVKLLYADGTQETRYSYGRVRLKDKDGNLIMDSGGIR